MKFKYNLFAFVFIGFIGTISHFVYDWTGENQIIGYFFPINESTWEHLKLLFFPTVIYSFAEYFFVKREIKNYVASIVISLIIGIFTIITLFYTYKGVLGFNVDFINIMTYYIALIIMLITKNKIIRSEKYKSETSGLIFLCFGFLIALLFVFYTYNPPSIALFSPPN